MLLLYYFLAATLPLCITQVTISTESDSSIQLGTPGQLDSNKYSRTNKKEKLFMCKVCGRGFIWRSQLNVHNRIHTGEKPFKCHVCGKEFIRRNHLTVHDRIHTGEKPFKCDVCSKGFNERSNLKKHYRIHTGEKPFKCDMCGKKFTQRMHLNKHKPCKLNACNSEFNQNHNLPRQTEKHEDSAQIPQCMATISADDIISTTLLIEKIISYAEL